MRTVGQLLREERQKKGFSLEQVEKATKIRRKFLEAIETDQYKLIPASPYIQGFIKNYSDFLELKSYTILALLRRQLSGKENQAKAVLEEPLTPSSWRLTPNKVIFVMVFILIVSLFGYFLWQYQNLHAAPPLTVASPNDDSVTKATEVPVFGDTDPDVSLTINSEPVVVKTDGKFYKDLLLTVGGNTIKVEAVTRVGKKSTVVKRVTRLPVDDINSP